MAEQFGGETVDNVNIAVAAAADNNNQPQRNNNGAMGQQQPPHPMFNIQDRLFHAMFYRVAVAYATAVPPGFRILLEFCALFKVRELNQPEVLELLVKLYLI